MTVNRLLDRHPPYVRLSDAEWVGTKHRHEWECVFGHKTQRTFDNIKSALRENKSACTKCKILYHGEETLRFAMETVTKENFPKMRPNWLTDPVTGNPLELDGYSETLKLAFEFDGRQHDEHVSYFQPKKADFENQQRKDQVKEMLCEKAGVTLVRVKEDDNIVQNPDFLISKLRSLRPEVIKNTILDWKNFEPNNCYDLLEKAKSHAEKNGGSCITNVILSPSDKVQFHCPKHDYSWESKYSVAITRDQWCKKCGHKVRAEKQTNRLNDDQIHKICKTADPSIKFLSWAGKDDKGRNLWKCENPSCEFPFKMSAANLALKIEKREKPCPSCNKKRRVSIWEFHRYAELKGGICLTLNDADQIMFKCHNHEHPQFELTKSQAKGGLWCKLCPDRKKQKLPDDLVEKTVKDHGYRLASVYVNNHSQLELECLKCGRPRNDISYKQLERAEKAGSLTVACEFCGPIPE